jgi:hypothetical protein
MTVLPTSLTGSDDDWIECVRRYLYPRLDPYWPMSTLTIGSDGYVTTIDAQGLSDASPGNDGPVSGTVDLDEDTLEVALEDIGFLRNPIAALKIHQDGRTSDGSWALLPENDPTGALKGHEQLHVTLFDAPDGGFDLYAHVETDWRDDPLGHLLNGGSLERGQNLTLELLHTESYLNPQTIYE